MALKKLKNAQPGDTVKLETPEYEWDDENHVLIALKASKNRREYRKEGQLAKKAVLETELAKVNIILAEIEANETGI